MGKRKNFLFILSFSRGGGGSREREREKKKKNERHSFALSLSLYPIHSRSSFLLSSSHREQGELLDGRACARVPRLGHRFCSGREFFLFSLSKRRDAFDRLINCARLHFSFPFAAPERENPQGGKGTLFVCLLEREESVLLVFHSRYARASVYFILCPSLRLAGERKSEGIDEKRASRGGRRRRRRCCRRHEGDDDWLSLLFPLLRSSPLLSSLSLFRAERTQPAPRNAAER